MVNEQQDLKMYEKKDRVKRIESGVENVQHRVVSIQNELQYMKLREQKFREF
jgi:hypothetical protein